LPGEVMAFIEAELFNDKKMDLIVYERLSVNLLALSRDVIY
jgi:hypothetical protein